MRQTIDCAQMVHSRIWFASHFGVLKLCCYFLGIQVKIYLLYMLLSHNKHTQLGLEDGGWGLLILSHAK